MQTLTHTHIGIQYVCIFNSPHHQRQAETNKQKGRNVYFLYSSSRIFLYSTWLVSILLGSLAVAFGQRFAWKQKGAEWSGEPICKRNKKPERWTKVKRIRLFYSSLTISDLVKKKMDLET